MTETAAGYDCPAQSDPILYHRLADLHLELANTWRAFQDPESRAFASRHELAASRYRAFANGIRRPVAEVAP